MILSPKDKNAIYNIIATKKEYKEVRDILGSLDKGHFTDEEKEIIKDVIADILIEQIDDVCDYVIERSAAENEAKKVMKERADATQELLDAIKKYKSVTGTANKDYNYWIYRL